jgi:hypothetical protein
MRVSLSYKWAKGRCERPGKEFGEEYQTVEERVGDSMKAYQSGTSIDPEIRHVSTSLFPVLPTCLIQPSRRVCRIWK